MTQLTSSGFLTIGDAQLAYRVSGDPAAPPAIVLLHEELGSAALWGDFPARLAAATGVTVLAYSRAGYGASSPVALPRPLTFMHDEAKYVLPPLLDATSRTGFSGQIMKPRRSDVPLRRYATKCIFKQSAS